MKDANSAVMYMLVKVLVCLTVVLGALLTYSMFPVSTATAASAVPENNRSAIRTSGN